MTDRKPYAWEFGRDNGDGTYSVVIERALPDAKCISNAYPVTPLFKEEDSGGDAFEALEAEVARLKDQIYESIPKWQANDLQQKLDSAEVEVARLRGALRIWEEAYRTGRHEPLAIASDAARASLRKEETP